MSTLESLMQALDAADRASLELGEAFADHVLSLPLVERVEFIEAFPWQRMPDVSTSAIGFLTEALREMPYDQYLRTAHWQRKRQDALVRADHRCQACSTTKRLQVHHRTYDRRGCEALEDLTVLCDGCHKVFHEHRRLSRA